MDQRKLFSTLTTVPSPHQALEKTEKTSQQQKLNSLLRPQSMRPMKSVAKLKSIKPAFKVEEN